VHFPVNGSKELPSSTPRGRDVIFCVVQGIDATPALARSEGAIFVTPSQQQRPAVPKHGLSNKKADRTKSETL
jgi:hypothetical protein